MPACPIVDAHLHLWEPDRFRMSWLDGNELLDRPYTLDDYREHTAGLPIEAMVYLQVDVEPPYALLEAERVVELAREEPRLQAIVAWAPLEYGERARSFLAALVRNGPLIKGVRRILQSEPDDFGTRPDFMRGVRLLPEYGLSFDVCINYRQLPAAIAMARACPETAIMLDHIAKPNIREQLLDPWREQMRELASLPNVWCKISGVATEADHAAWTADDLAPYIHHAVEVFGEARIAFGGDWPVALMATSYRRWVETLDMLTAELAAPAQARLWGENARDFYRIGS